MVAKTKSHGEYFNKSLQALARSAGAFKRVEVKYLPPLPDQGYSVIQTSQWQELLQTLKALIIELPHVEDNDGESLTICHTAFLVKFSDLFFESGINLEHLRVQAHEAAFMCQYEYRTTICWSVIKMPRPMRFELTFTLWSAFFWVTVLDYATDEVAETRSDKPEWSDCDPDSKRGFSEIVPKRRDRAFAAGETCESYGFLVGSWNRDRNWDSDEEDWSDGDEIMRF
ncbi:hypothetical protein HJFPF1_02578 [Paramyrothecium foliicola]|nr:hypothetical protein HJFPF1_02578 [Paramyrothecium foliicola]